MNDDLAVAMAAFTDATGTLLARRGLQRRVDTKYLVPEQRLLSLIASLGAGYAVLRASGRALATYHSLYLDTPALHCFHDHRRGRRVRHKVRVRHYLDRGLSYLEVKTKRNDLVTDKHRLPIAYGQQELGAAEHEFLRSRVGALADTLRPELWITYQRISLIGVETDERVTIDVALEVIDLEGARQRLTGVAVVEVKRAPSSGRTPVMRALASAGHRERSMSKYTAAIAILRSGERLNRLRPGLRAIEGLSR